MGDGFRPFSEEAGAVTSRGGANTRLRALLEAMPSSESYVRDAAAVSALLQSLPRQSLCPRRRKPRCAHRAARSGHRRLKEIPGVGDAIADIITKLHAHGTHPSLEAMRKDIPVGVLEMLTVPGLRPDKIVKLYKELGIRSRHGPVATAVRESLRPSRGPRDRTPRPGNRRQRPPYGQDGQSEGRSGTIHEVPT